MGMIQGSINSLLTTVAVATRLSPELEAKAKIRGELALQKQKLKLLEGQGAAEGDTNTEDLRKKSEILKNIYELNPTSANLEKYGEADYAASQAAAGEERVKTALEQSQAFKKEFMQGFEEVEKPSRAAVQKRLAEKKAAEALQMEQDRISRGGTV